jgi:flavin reductase (DIM6/NTAB) family NADH-FMN oxidoreductase RutF
VFFDPRSGELPAALTHNPFLALVAPRPIAWVSSMGAGGQLNLAPFSHFNAVSVEPAMVMFAPNSKDEAETPKDTLRNVREIPEFVVNVVSWPQREAMNLSSRALDYGESEFALTGVKAVPSVNVRPPRVADSRAALECKVWRIIELPAGENQRQCHIVIGEVVGIHLAPEVIVDGKISSARLEQVARLGYFEYLVVRETFEMPRPR